MSTIPSGKQSNAQCHSCKWSDRPEDCGTCGGTGYVGDIDRPDTEPSGPVPGGPVPGGRQAGAACGNCRWSDKPENCGMCDGRGYVDSIDTHTDTSLGVT